MVPRPHCTCVHPGRRTTLCTVTRFVDQGAFGEVYQVVWKGVGTDWGSTMAMKTVRLADISSDKRDEYRVLLVEEILTVRPYQSVWRDGHSFKIENTAQYDRQFELEIELFFSTIN